MENNDESTQEEYLDLSEQQDLLTFDLEFQNPFEDLDIGV